MKEELHNFQSFALGNRRRIWIRSPQELVPETNLLIILDAELYRDRVNAPMVIDELISNKTMSEALIVYVSYCDIDARWIECPCYPPFVSFIADELYPWIEENYPCIKRAKERVIAGLSYTGLAASFVALTSKGLFTKVISQSGSYWSNDCWLPLEVKKIESDSKPAFYLDVGDKEIEVNVLHKEDVFQVVSQIDGVERMRVALIENGHSVKYEVFDGGHSSEGWASSLPRALQWALPNNALQSTQTSCAD